MITQLEKKNTVLYITVGVLVIAMLVALCLLGTSQDSDWKPIGQFISAVLSAAIVACLTLLLLQSQAINQNHVDAYKVIFESKMQFFDRFYQQLDKLVSKDTFTEEDMKKMQFHTAALAIHLSPEELQKISHCIKQIEFKKNNPKCADPSVWYEISLVSSIIHDHLYMDAWKQGLNAEVISNQRSMDNIEANPIRQMLYRIECNIAPYHFYSVVEEQYLKITIPINKDGIKYLSDDVKSKIASSYIFAIVEITKTNDSADMFDGRIRLSLHDKDVNGRFCDIANEKFWLDKKGIHIDVTTGDYYITFENRPEGSILQRTYDMLNLCADMWMTENKAIPRLNRNGDVFEDRILDKFHTSE